MRQAILVGEGNCVQESRAAFDLPQQPSARHHQSVKTRLGPRRGGEVLELVLLRCFRQRLQVKLGGLRRRTQSSEERPLRVCVDDCVQVRPVVASPDVLPLDRVEVLDAGSLTAVQQQCSR